jgi:hypothetical protein
MVAAGMIEERGELSFDLLHEAIMKTQQTLKIMTVVIIFFMAIVFGN